MTIESSNLSNSEYYRLNGTLSTERIEALLLMDDSRNAVSDPSGYIEEAINTFPNEDFLQAIIKKVQKLSKRVRGDNRDELDQIAIDLEDLQTEVSNNGDYGRSELEKALEDISTILA